MINPPTAIGIREIFDFSEIRIYPLIIPISANDTPVRTENPILLTVVV